jgi:hypothetical protein
MFVRFMLPFQVEKKKTECHIKVLFMKDMYLLSYVKTCTR